jgi:hypothetical protein
MDNRLPMRALLASFVAHEVRFNLRSLRFRFLATPRATTVARRLPLVFPIHPRTRKALARLGARAGRGVNEVAVQQHGRADADRRTADRGDERLGHLRQPADEIEGSRRPRVRRPLEKVLEIVASREAVA